MKRERDTEKSSYPSLFIMDCCHKGMEDFKHYCHKGTEEFKYYCHKGMEDFTYYCHKGMETIVKRAWKI